MMIEREYLELRLELERVYRENVSVDYELDILPPQDLQLIPREVREHLVDLWTQQLLSKMDKYWQGEGASKDRQQLQKIWQEKCKRKRHNRRNNFRDCQLRRRGIGDKCECCGETRWEFLSIDHVEGGGSKKRKELGGGSTSNRREFESGSPGEGYRILCHSCNFAWGKYGYCPHVLQTR